MRPEAWKDVRNILAIRLDNIGDVVMLGPSLRTLKQALPEAKITLMVSPAGSQIAPLLPWVDEIMVHRAVWQDASWAMPLDPAREQELIETLKVKQFDAAVIFTSFSQSPYLPAYVCYLAGIPIRLGQSKEFGGSVLSQWVKPLPDATHQVDRNLFLLESAGFITAGRHLELSVPDEVQQRTNQILQGAGVDPNAPFIVLAPGASCPARRYDPERFAVATRIIGQESGLPIVVVGNTKETELTAPILAEAAHTRIISLVGQTSVPELVAVIRRSAFVFANDSGPMHLADAFLRPMVITYSGTEYESQWGPRFAPTKLLRRPTNCSPCYNFKCPYHMECLDIPPAEVATAVLEMLSVSSSEFRAPSSNLFG
jgi:lipopolysaccharide heptosyltransferase II